LSIDGEVDTREVKLSRYPDANIYYPYDWYFSSFALPLEWMEAFYDHTKKFYKKRWRIGNQNEYDPAIDMAKVTPSKFTRKLCSSTTSVDLDIIQTKRCSNTGNIPRTTKNIQRT